MNEFEKDIKRAVDIGTQNTEKQKERIWRGVDAQIGVYEMRKKKTKSAFMAASIIGLALVVFTAFTPVGMAAVNKIVAMFAPEKEVTTSIEGEEEASQNNLYIDAEKEESQVIITQEPEQTPEQAQDKQASYAIYVDEAHYMLEKQGDVDVISPKDYPEDYPRVDMQIYQEQDVTIEDMATQMYASLQESFDTVFDTQSFTMTNIQGVNLYAFNGHLDGDKETMPQWDDAVVKVYIIENKLGGVFVIRMQYFSEAEEGHGERMDAMLNQFEVIAPN